MWTKYKQTRYLIDKAILVKTGGVYVTFVTDVDKGQRHVVTLVWSFKTVWPKLGSQTVYWVADLKMTLTNFSVFSTLVFLSS